MRIILVNRFDRSCRDWLTSNQIEDDIILDWYKPEDQLAWIEAGGTDKISSFPVVLEKEK